MSRNNNSTFEDIVEITSKVPWWGGIILAIISGLLLHGVATMTVAPFTGVGQMGAYTVKVLIRTLAMFGQFIFPFAFLLGALISGIKGVRQKRLYKNVEARTDVGALNDLTWEDFEMLLCEYYRRQGFQVSHEGGNGPDGGIDITLRLKGELHLVQCKQWRAFKVGVQPVREFYGVMAARGAASGYFVTSGVFTEEAQKFAHGLNLELIDGGQLRKMIDEARTTSVKEVISRQEPNPRPAADQSPASESTAVSNCPRCGEKMVKRVAKEGVSAGKPFWGCSSYPKCHGTRDIEEKNSDWVIVPPGTNNSTATEPLTKPCPDCSTEMSLRQFKSGQKAGQFFYGCTECKKGWPVISA